MTKKIIARYGMPKIDQVIRNLEFFSKSKQGSNEFLKEFDFYLKCRVGEYKKSKEIIERETDRIEKIKKAIDLSINGVVIDPVQKKHFKDLYSNLELFNG